MPDFADARARMVEVQLRRRGIHDENVLRAMQVTPREMFVPPDLEAFAYEDSPLPIGEGQTISQPYIVALMLQAAAIRPDDVVLDVGAGSGYAAAVLSRMARRVFTIERHAPLAQEAERRFRALDYDNIAVRIGDGSKGWPEAAPFAAILVAAAASAVPAALTGQLAPGGRLIIPVEERGGQRLVCITRTGETSFEEEDLAGVMFVPLVVGPEEESEAPAMRAGVTRAASLAQRIAAEAEPLPSPDDPGFAEAFDRFADRRVVLLGEATHGTSEFYRARAAITRRLVEKHGFTIISVEADWPDAAAIDRQVRGRRPLPAVQGEAPFRRFPTWMWRNREFSQFLDWLRRHNEQMKAGEKAGFFGLDIYNLDASITSVLAYLDGVDPRAAEIARQRYGCLTPWRGEPAAYGAAVIKARYEGCAEDVVAQCRELLSRSLELSARDEDAFLDAAQSARLVAAAERYYRVMYYGGPAAWNLRDDHMADTLSSLLAAKGPAARAVVWAHNSHVGDARHTDMGRRDEISLGQRCRERFGQEAALIGFGTHGGQVAAAGEWGGAVAFMDIRPALADSFERLFHEAGLTRHLLDFHRSAGLKQALALQRLERFIGVIYRPETERRSHYAHASLSEQFDAFVWFDHTGPVSPFDRQAMPPETADTFPFGV